MIRWREGVVTRVAGQWRGATELEVEMDGVQVLALAYTDEVGEPEIGDRVILNATALLMGLGTGGYALVIAIPDRLPPDRPLDVGHMVKARYSPMQSTVLGVDEQDSLDHATISETDSIDGAPVVLADLHSSLPAIVAGIRAERPRARVVYVMTDGAALPLAFSRNVAALGEHGWIAATVTVGQAYGGDVEAVSLHTGLLAATHVLGADVVVVIQGPGNLGTGTTWGFSGVSVGEHVNAVAVLGGRPIASLRVSEGDTRRRHYGVSHHSLTAYGRVALLPAEVPVPVLPGEFGALVRDQAGQLAPRHRLVDVPVDGLSEALAASPVPLSTMGRGMDTDAAAFLAAAAAGRYAAS